MGIMAQVLDKMREIRDAGYIGAAEDEQGNPVCYYCGEPIRPFNTEQDHILPRSKHGSNRPYNFVAACHRCNQAKHDKHPLAWDGNLEDLPDEVAVDFLARLLSGNTFYGAWVKHENLELNYKSAFNAFVPAGYRGPIRFGCPKCGSSTRMAVTSRAIMASLWCEACHASEDFLVFILDPSDPVLREDP